MSAHTVMLTTTKTKPLLTLHLSLALCLSYLFCLSVHLLFICLPFCVFSNVFDYHLRLLPSGLFGYNCRYLEQYGISIINIKEWNSLIYLSILLHLFDLVI